MLSARRKFNLKVSKCWIQQFIIKNPEIQTKKYQKYNYEKILCEDPKIIQNWFNLIWNTINKYNIFSFDIWNFDKSKFAMGILGFDIIIIKVNSIDKQSNI